jgi:hypothetical protein
VFLTPPNLAGPQLLEPREQEALVWGIGHFVAEEPTRWLDLAATVRDTAKAGGIPHLLFHQARYPREVWLWIDEAADDPSIPRIADEIEAALQTHGLPIEKALFRGVPDLLVNASGQTFAPNEVDERRDAALVAILTDGRVLARQYAADDRRVRLDALLRSLSHWPRLAFVDFAAESGDLTAILAKHSLLRMAPSGLAAFLGGNETAKRKTGGSVSGDAAWAAACAVAPSSVDELRAFQLRKRLGLATSPWALRDLRAQAPGPPGRLQWQPQDRARRVNWLFAMEAQAENSVAPGSLLGRTLDFWEEIYDRELKGGSRLETPADQHLAMECALLSLWRNPGKGARDLYPLHSGALRDVVKRHLQHLAPATWGSAELLHLPWSWESLPAPERVMFQRMGLGGGMPAARLRRPGRLWVGLALCLGLAAGAFRTAALSGWRQPQEPPIIIHGPGKPTDAFEIVRTGKTFSEVLADYIRGGDSGWIITVGTRTSLVSQTTHSGGRASVHWGQNRQPCVSKSGNGSESWYCGTIGNPLRFSNSPGRRVIVLSTSAPSPEAALLAVDLLDSGSADQVILSNFLIRLSDLGKLIAPKEDKVETLIVPELDWGILRSGLRFNGLRAIQQVWPDVVLLYGSPSAQLRGLSACRNGETIEENGMTFVRVCPGAFTMGSTADDPQARDEEKPAHQVTLNEYWIGSTEVTKAEYRAIQTGNLGEDMLPVTSVTWHEAKTFCERHGWRLPTEAEWEYAARAGTQTPWSFGADEGRLGQFASSRASAPHPVGTKKPNPWGIYDMHGNVWEWVADWYGPYKPGLQKDPKGPDIGEGRSVRGGAFVTPEDLRSAGRFGNQPTNRGSLIGFRCARNPRRQP